jgi:mannose-6-phosphate isomerase-like protein (cupin superfamily)
VSHSTQPTSARAALHVVRPDEGLLGPLRILAGGEQTRSCYFALEWQTPPTHPGPPSGWHSHEEHDEGEYVLTGEREIFIDDQRWQGGPGLFALSPRRTRHTMRTSGPDPSLWLHFFSPAGLEHFFAERERLRAHGASPDEIRALGRQYGMRDAPRSRATESPVASAAATRRDGTVVTGEHTRNAYALAERSVLPAEAHVHDTQEEGFYVIRGELTVEADGAELVLPARSFVLIPRGLPRRHVTSPGAQVLVIASPGHAVLH